MTTTAQQVPHPWAKDALLPKAKLYAEEMHKWTHDDWRFVLWSTLTLELLCRAAVANIGSALLADAKDAANTIYSLGLKPKAQKFVPKSIDISSVVRLLQELIDEFTPELAGFTLAHMVRRNEELHAGSSPLEGLPSSSWLPLFYRTCKVLLSSMNEDLLSFLGVLTTMAAEQMIKASLDSSAKAVAKAIEAHKTVWENKTPEEKNQAASQAKNWAIKQEGHRAECPSCGSDALLTGQPIDSPSKSIAGDLITVVQQYLPSKFECIACGLKVAGLPQLSAAGLGDAYNATFTYDASQYYAPDSPEDQGYEPDFNE